MDIAKFLPILFKIALILFLFIYLIFGVLLFRQTVLMNRAIKTKLAGCLNFIAILNLLGILIGLLLVIVV